MLDRLIRADRTSELETGPRVLGRHLEAALRAAADLLRREARSRQARVAPLDRRRRVNRSRSRVAGVPENEKPRELSCEIERRQERSLEVRRAAFDAEELEARCVPRCHENDVGDVTVGYERGNAVDPPGIAVLGRGEGRSFPSPVASVAISLPAAISPSTAESFATALSAANR